MAKLICARCGGEKPVPRVGDRRGVPSKKDPTKLTCRIHGEKCVTLDIPHCCGIPMKYTT